MKKFLLILVILAALYAVYWVFTNIGQVQSEKEAAAAELGSVEGQGGPSSKAETRGQVGSVVWDAMNPI